MKQEREYVYKSTLSKEYGLSPSLIAELGAPDKYVENPHYKSGPEASLYSVERVEKWITDNQERVDEARTIRTKRSEAAKEAHEKKRNEKRRNALKWIRRAPLKISDLPDDLFALASRHYGLRAQIDVPTEKGLVAYVRHYLSDYDKLRSAIREQEWWLQDELYVELRERIDHEAKRRLVEWEQAHLTTLA